MATRPYPRFLFSNPKNVKSDGAFVVHLLHPRAIFKVEKRTSTFYINLLEVLEDDQDTMSLVAQRNVELYLLEFLNFNKDLPW